MELSKTLATVRALIAKAEDCDNPESSAFNPAEAQAYRDKADALMLKYAIDEAMLEMARPAAERTKPEVIEVEIGKYSDMTGWLLTMTSNLARHCRCRIRNNSRYNKGVWFSKVYGFSSDLRYFEFLYTTIRLHFLGALRPQIDPALTLADNAYNFHNAGYNWLAMAEFYGWRKVDVYGWDWGDHCEEHPEDTDTKVPYKNRETDEYAPATKIGGIFKRAYLAAVKARGETPTQIPASGTEAFRYCAAQAYVNRIRIRLADTERKRGEAGSELVLRTDDLDEFFKAENPDLFVEREPVPPCPECEKAKSGHCRKHPKGSYGRTIAWSSAGYARGTAHANTADLTGGQTPGRTKKAVEA
jgi:Protein of unknown function (DUF2786)